MSDHSSNCNMEDAPIIPLVLFKVRSHEKICMPKIIQSTRPTRKFAIDFEKMTNVSETEEQETPVITPINLQRKQGGCLLCNEFSLHTLFLLKHYILDVFFIQLICFILKLILMIIYIIAIIIMISNGVGFIISLIGYSSAIACIIMTCFIFYHVGISNAYLKNKLGCCFRITVVINYLLCSGALIGFLYIIKREVIDDDLNLDCEYKLWIDYALVLCPLLYYLLGVSVFPFILGMILCVLKIIWFILSFIFEAFVGGLYIDSSLINEQEAYNITKSQKVNPELSNESEMKLDGIKSTIMNTEGENFQSNFNNNEPDIKLARTELYPLREQTKGIDKTKFRPISCVIREYMTLL